MDDKEVQKVTEPENQGSEESGKDKTFTQEEVDKIVKSRILKEKEKFESKKKDIQESSNSNEDYKTIVEEKNRLQTELNKLKKKNQVKEMKNAISKETGVPANLLYGEDEDTCRAQAEEILEFAKPNSYPKVKDAGETRTITSKKTRDMFKEWVEENSKN